MATADPQQSGERKGAPDFLKAVGAETDDRQHRGGDEEVDTPVPGSALMFNIYNYKFVLAVMNGLTQGERRKLMAFFEGMNGQDIRYVILRKYEGLPDRVDDDVDVLIDAGDFEHALELATEIGLERATDGISVPQAVSVAIQDPLSAAKKGLDLVRDTPSLQTGEQSVRRDEPVKRKLVYRNLDIDAVNHLACPEGSKRCVPRTVEAEMLTRRRRLGEFYVPADVDELAHYVVHCLVDYEGVFPPYYAPKCGALAEAIGGDAGKRAEFRKLMEVLFGDAAEPLTERVLSGDFDRLRTVVGDEIDERVVRGPRARPSERARS